MTINNALTVGQLLASAFEAARVRKALLHETWIKISSEIGRRLPNSLVMMSVQRAGELDLALRCMESDFNALERNIDNFHLLTFNTQTTLSELWVGSIYEIVRLIQDRKVMPSDDLAALYSQLTLLRVPLMKHEIAGERKMTKPLLFKKHPPNDADSDLYTYSHKDPRRGHIMPHGVSQRGSVMWQVIDIKTEKEYWLERLTLSEQFLSIFSSTT